MQTNFNNSILKKTDPVWVWITRKEKERIHLIQKVFLKTQSFYNRKNRTLKKKLRTQNSDTNLEAYFTGGVALLVTPPLYTIPVCKLKTRKQKKERWNFVVENKLKSKIKTHPHKKKRLQPCLILPGLKHAHKNKEIEQAFFPFFFFFLLNTGFFFTLTVPEQAQGASKLLQLCNSSSWQILQYENA